MKHAITQTTTLALLIALTGCAKPADNAASSTDAEKTAAAPHSNAWILTSAPQGDVSITQAKVNAQEGDQVVIRGRIGGRHEPLSAGSPVFTVVDLGLAYCSQHEEDGCATPWDYCCETPDTIAANSATVQVQGDAIDLEAAGLEPLDEVVLIGTVGPRPDAQVFTIRATGVYPVGG